MSDDVDLHALEQLVRQCEARQERRECGEVRLVLARALVGSRNRHQRLELSALLLRIEHLLAKNHAAAGPSPR